MSVASDACPTSSVAPAHTRVTRQDWITAATETLAGAGVDHVRILTLAERLDVARSSFYWYFTSREALLDELLATWSSRNTSSIVGRASRPSATICAAVLGVFECWADDALFDPRLDAAVRDWARRDATVAAAVAAADAARLDSLEAMYARHGFGDDALVRSRVLYYTQIGYYALGVDESTDVRLSRARSYAVALTGQQPTDDELATFAAFLHREDSA